MPPMTYRRTLYAYRPERIRQGSDDNRPSCVEHASQLPSHPRRSKDQIAYILW